MSSLFVREGLIREFLSSFVCPQFDHRLLLNWISIDLFSLDGLLPHFRPCDDTLENYRMHMDKRTNICKISLGLNIIHGLSPGVSVDHLA